MKKENVGVAILGLVIGGAAGYFAASRGGDMTKSPSMEIDPDPQEISAMASAMAEDLDESMEGGEENV